MRWGVAILWMIGAQPAQATALSWHDDLRLFLDALTKDPRDPQAHARIERATRQIQLQNNATVQEARLRVLSQAAERLEGVHMDARSLEKAILDTTEVDERARQDRWEGLCDEAEMNMDLDRPLQAHGLIFEVLAENAGYPRAQQLLAELQSRFQEQRKNVSAWSSEERFALEGFDAYGRADYESAVTAWAKVFALLRQSYAASEIPKRLDALYFEPYWKIAEEVVQVHRRIAETQALFQRATQMYAQKRFYDALHHFRRVAVLNPDYPQLGFYLAQAEAAVEKDRARRLGERKQKEIARLFDQGLFALQGERYGEAERFFLQVLTGDSEHIQARSYLAMTQAELHRRHDPKAADAHYEAGLIAYAGGKLEEAVREWSIAIRMNPKHPKAFQARAKVQKELSLHHETVP
jgi:tetratricopeptide (TPR) repeat protein